MRKIEGSFLFYKVQALIIVLFRCVTVIYEAIDRIHQIEDTFYHETMHKKSLEPYTERVTTVFDVTDDNIVQCKQCPYIANRDKKQSNKKKRRSDETVRVYYTVLFHL